MGSKLAVLAGHLTLALVLASGRMAHADTPKARELFKLGIEEYKAQRYAAAAAILARAYELGQAPDALFALAQAERLDNRCPEAIVHYKKLLATSKDPAIAQAVQTNMALCPLTEPKPAPPPLPEPVAKPDPEPAPPPQVITRTVVKDSGGGDTLGTVMFAGGMLALGVGAGFFVASKGSMDDADVARTLDVHNELADRAKTQRTISFVALGAGAAMIGVAIWRWTSGGDETSTSSEVAISPTSGGSLVTWSARW